MPTYRVFALLAPLALALACPAAAHAQKKTAPLKSPEPGYAYPSGGRAGSTVAVQLGGFDWTPDLEFFLLDSRATLKTTGAPGPIIVPPPPYWFGPKAYIVPLPLPREQPAAITLPADLPPGPVRWAVAGASGAGLKTGIFWVGTGAEVSEERAAKLPQKLPPLPVTVNGRLEKVEEVDRYLFTAVKDGPVTLDVFARRLGVNMNSAVTVRDAKGSVVVDAVDTDGNDLALTFWATGGAAYTVELHDLDFRGDRSFVYRLALTAGPRVVASVPAAGTRGQTRDVEFVGYGVATGKPKLESVTRKVTFPTDPKARALAYRLETAFGSAAYDIPLSDVAEGVASAKGPSLLSLPAAATGVFDQSTEARFAVEGKKGDVLNLAAEARRFVSPLDLSLAVLDGTGKELARNDDLPGTTDAGLVFTVPADGPYTVVVNDLSGKAGTRAAVYRITASKAPPDFTLSTTARLNVPLGGAADLVVKVARKGGSKDPIAISLSGLPEGVTVPPNLVIPADKPELKITLTGAEGAPAAASLVTVSGTAGGVTRQALAPITGNLASRAPDDEQTASLLIATTLAPRLKVVAVEADGGRKVHRGSTHPAEVTLERLNGFQGDVHLWMSAAQSYQRQGITGPDMVVGANESRAFYPCFMPEWLETTRTSRMELIGVVTVPDAKGKTRYLVTPMSGRITMSIEGAIMKVSAPQELSIKPGETVEVMVSVLRSEKLSVPVQLELSLPDELREAFKAAPVTVPPGQTTAVFKLTRVKDVSADQDVKVTVRGTALQDGKYPVVSEAAIAVECPAK
ncbi:MAG: PPC domain-containing protein [Gemmata sp.]